MQVTLPTTKRKLSIWQLLTFYLTSSSSFSFLLRPFLASGEVAVLSSFLSFSLSRPLREMSFVPKLFLRLLRFEALFEPSLSTSLRFSGDFKGETLPVETRPSDGFLLSSGLLLLEIRSLRGSLASWS